MCCSTCEQTQYSGQLTACIGRTEHWILPLQIQEWAFGLVLMTLLHLNFCCSLQMWVAEVKCYPELEVLRDKGLESAFALCVSKSLSKFMHLTVGLLIIISYSWMRIWAVQKVLQNWRIEDCRRSCESRGLEAVSWTLSPVPSSHCAHPWAQWRHRHFSQGLTYSQ